VEGMEEKTGEEEGEGEGKNAEHEGLGDELPDQQAAVRTEHLSNRDFPCPGRSPNRGEVRGIDTGDRQEERRDRRKYEDVSTVADRSNPVTDARRAQIHVGQRLEDEVKPASCSVDVVVVETDTRKRRAILPDHIYDSVVHGAQIGSILQPDIR